MQLLSQWPLLQRHFLFQNHVKRSRPPLLFSLPLSFYWGLRGQRREIAVFNRLCLTGSLSSYILLYPILFNKLFYNLNFLIEYMLFLASREGSSNLLASHFLDLCITSDLQLPFQVMWPLLWSHPVQLFWIFKIDQLYNYWSICIVEQLLLIVLQVKLTYLFAFEVQGVHPVSKTFLSSRVTSFDVMQWGVLESEHW